MLSIAIAHPVLPPRTVALDPSALVGDGVAIGRVARNPIVLDDPAVSRLHARLVLREGRLQVIDAGSSGGTVLNDVTLPPERPTPIAAGDVLRIGGFTLRIADAEPIVVDTGDEACATMIADPPVAAYLPLAAPPAEGFAVWSGGEIALRVQRVIVETPDVRTFVLAADVPTLFRYLPGQFLAVHLVIDGQPVRRSYTISSSPSRPHTLAITVKRAAGGDGRPAGLASTWLHEHLVPGDRLTVSGPYGDFSCAAHPSPRLLLISAGSGITPMLSMARWLTDGCAAVDTVFLHSARTSADLIARRELELLAEHDSRLRLVFATTRPEPGAGWTGVRGRIDGDLLRLAVPDLLRRRVFCCGPEPFMAAVRARLVAEGFDLARFHHESFGGGPVAAAPPAAAAAMAPAPGGGSGLRAVLRAVDGGRVATPTRASPVVPPPAPAAPVSVRFVRSGRDAACAGGQSVLEAGEAAGLALPFGCRSGRCGACKLRRVAGEIVRAGYDDAVLPPPERATHVLACVARPAGSFAVDA